MSEEIEAKAVAMGWKPQEEFKGDPEKWRPAEEFVERGENILPILKDRVGKLEADLKIATAANRQEIERVKKETYALAKKEYDAQVKALEKKELEAFQTGDADAYQEVKRERETVKPPEKPVDVPQNPVFEQWSSKNSWYQADAELTEYADYIGEKTAKANPHYTVAQVYDEVEKKIKAQFPAKFTNPRRDEAGAVEGGTPTNGGKKNGQSFDSLPASAKQQYERMARNFKVQGREFKKEDYASAYYEQK